MLGIARAQALVAAALSDADRQGLVVSVAVVDASGYLLAFGRADGARAYTAEVAQGKAYSVVFMGRSTADLRDLAGTRPAFFAAVSSLGLRGLIPSPGGVAVADGAIGVSGAPDPDQDVEVALAAIEATTGPG
ncbi:MAG: GlcG/HbpS family heme-binding protein [Solirubrobacterales bacterium]